MSFGVESQQPSQMNFTLLCENAFLNDAHSIDSCSKFIAIGTLNGKVYLLDYSGCVILNLSPHESAVSQVVISKDEGYVASSGQDGQIALFNVTNPSDRALIRFNRPIETLQFDPNFINSGRMICGGKAAEVVLFYPKQDSWFKKSKKVIASNVGSIVALSWVYDLIACATDTFIEIYDSKSNYFPICRLSIPFNHFRPDSFKCLFLWKRLDTLLICWNQSLQLVCFKDEGYLLHNYNVSVVWSTKTDFVIQSAQFYKSNLLLIAEYEDSRAELLEIGIRNSDIRHCDDLSLERNNAICLGSKMFFLINGQKLFVLEPRGINDQIEWLINQKFFEKAYHTSIESGQKIEERFQHEALGLQLLTEMLELNEFERAAAFCPTVLKDSAHLWETWILVFVQRKIPEFILKYIPIGFLNQNVYQSVLEYFVESDAKTFNFLIQSWPICYNTKELIQNVEKKPSNTYFLNSLLTLYTQVDDEIKVLKCHVALKNYRACVCRLNANPSLFCELENDEILLFFEFCFDFCDKDVALFISSEAISILVKNTNLISTEKILKAVNNLNIFCFVYMYSLYLENPKIYPEHQEKLLELLPEHYPAGLMNFFKQSSNYNLERALCLCKQFDLKNEQVHLHTVMGNYQSALKIILFSIQDNVMAIEYVKKIKDPGLWDFLVDYASENTEFWTSILEESDNLYDQVLLIKRIPHDKEIEGLRRILLNILKQASNLLDIKQTCYEIQSQDLDKLMCSLVGNSCKGVLLDSENDLLE